MGAFWEIFGLVLLSSVKFLFAPSVAIGAGFGYLQTIVITYCGGCLGILFFYFFGTFMMRKFSKKTVSENRKKKIFTPTNKMIVKIKSKYGLIGLSFITPAIISIPVGTILAAKYFRKNPKTLSYLLTSLFIWCLFLSTLSYLLKASFFS
jgi:hypothetical protein